ncbi:MAG: sporulation protein YunB [bacterium]|nr:sporulation protein YunB [bacterium]
MKKSDIFLIITIIVFILTYIFIKIFTYKSEKILNNYAKRNSTNIVTNIINDSIYEVLYDNNYDDLIQIDKNNSNEINSLNFNNVKINNILYLTTQNILENIKVLESNNNLIYNVPIGVIYSLPILINIGPKIPFKIDILSDINSDADIKIKEYGINNVVVEVILNIELSVQVIFPFVSQTLNIEKQLILDSKVIQGNIPDYYGTYSSLKDKS